jgi:FtsP/CotA-like multicopper oxidase with cupredoxin domain
MGTLTVSRRDVLKVSALGAAALALPLERTVRAKTASKIASNKIPKPYALPFKVPPVIDGRGGGTITIAQKMANVEILPGVQTPIFGYSGITPGPTILVRRGTPLNVVMRNELPAKHPNLGLRGLDLVPPARFGVQAAVRRLRQRHHEGRAGQDLPVPERPGSPLALVPRPRRAPHG